MVPDVVSLLAPSWESFSLSPQLPVFHYIQYVSGKSPERGADVVVLLDGSIVVEQSRLRAGHDVEAIGRSRMLKVVYDGGQNGGKDLQIGQPVLQKTIIQVGTCPSAVSSTFSHLEHDGAGWR